MKWSETITLAEPLRDVRATALPPDSELDRRVRAAEQAAYERGRLDGEKNLGEQMLQQRNELLELHQGVIESLRRAVPEVIQQTENCADANRAGMRPKNCRRHSHLAGTRRSRRARGGDADEGDRRNSSSSFIPTTSRCCANTNRRSFRVCPRPVRSSSSVPPKSAGAAAWCKPGSACSTRAAKPKSNSSANPFPHETRPAMSGPTLRRRAPARAFSARHRDLRPRRASHRAGHRIRRPRRRRRRNLPD